MRLLTSRSLVQTQLGEILCAAYHPDTTHSTRLHSVPHFFSMYIYSSTSVQVVQDCSLHQPHVRGGRVAGHLAACCGRILMIVLGLFLSCHIEHHILLTRCQKSQFHVREYKVTRVEAEAPRVSAFIAKYWSQSSRRGSMPAGSFWFAALYDQTEDCLIDLSHRRFEQKRVAAWRSVYW